MSDWTPSVGNPGYMERTLQKGAATIVVLRPMIDKEEATRREGKTRTALEGAMREYLHRRN